MVQYKSDMSLDAADEFDQMIYEIATDDQALPGRAMVPLKRLVFLKAHHVPEPLRGELRELQSMASRAHDMDKEGARTFISRIFSFRAKLT
jgi:hypothetical protein